jgi:hypothetical protein
MVFYSGKDKKQQVDKSKYKSRPTLHRVIREYEQSAITATEMIGIIMLREGINNEDL